MPQTFVHSVTTTLPRRRVWELFTDIANWSSMGGVYRNLRWDGEPWAQGSAILGELCYPMRMPLRCVIRRFEPGTLITYTAHSVAAGFATERTIRFRSVSFGTVIEIQNFGVGTPPDLPDGIAGFLKMLTLQCFDNFAEFCEETYRSEVLPILPRPAVPDYRTASRNATLRQA